MSIGEKFLIVFGVALSLILPTVVPLANAVDIPSTVEIEALTCGLVFSDGSATSIDYGTLLPDEISSEHTISVKNSGNSDADHFYISGTDWQDASDVTQMLVGVTHYAGGSPDYEDKIVLTSTPFDLGTPQAGSDFPYSFQIKAVLENPGFSGAVEQQVTFSTEC